MNPGPAWSPLWTELCSEAQSKEHNHGTERELRRSAGLLRNLEGMKPTSMVIQTSQRPVSSVFVFFSHATVFWSLFLANHAHHHRHPPLSELTPRSTSLSSSQPFLMYEGGLSPPLPLPPHTLHLPYLPLPYTPSCCHEDSPVLLKRGMEESGDIYLPIMLDPTRAGRNHGNLSVCVCVGSGVY